MLLFSHSVCMRSGLLVLALVVHGGCDSTGFSGSNSTRKIEQPPMIEGVDAGGARPVIENFTSETLTEKATVDVVFAIDTSGSMTDETTALNQNLASFLRNFINNNVDTRVTVVGESAVAPIPGMSVPTIQIPPELPKDRIAQFVSMVDSHDAIGVLNQFFASPAKPLALRPDGILEIVVISDDNGKRPGNLAVDFVKPQARAVHFNGIIGVSETSTEACDIANVGTEYQTLATQTQGLIFDLCSPDWTKLLNELSSAIVSRAGQGFMVTKDIDLSKAVTVNMNGQALDASQFEVVGRSVVIKIELPAGATVTVSYYPKQ